MFGVIRDVLGREHVLKLSRKRVPISQFFRFFLENIMVIILYLHVSIIYKGSSFEKKDQLVSLTKILLRSTPFEKILMKCAI